MYKRQIYDKAVNFKEFTLTETDQVAADALSVSIDTDKAPYYAARILDNVTIAPSPQWLQNLLMNEGIRPINNVVDVTNYILLYFGQPMHAFDLDTFEGNDIRVREARAGEKLVTLDGEERELEKMCIRDRAKRASSPIVKGLTASVFGGAT